jgi:hypothetical protein
MTCSEFQRELPELMEGNGSAIQEDHLQSCAICSDLVQDLRYIAEAAKLLVPMHDPSPRVWEGIERSLKDQSTPRPAGGPERPEPFLRPNAARGNMLKWVGAAAAVVLILAFISYNQIWRTEPQKSAAVETATNDPSLSLADQESLSEITLRAPAMRPNYEQSLRNVNAYIRDAEAAAQADPADADARTHLLNAYEQKETLYEMASSTP